MQAGTSFAGPPCSSGIADHRTGAQIQEAMGVDGERTTPKLSSLSTAGEKRDSNIWCRTEVLIVRFQPKSWFLQGCSATRIVGLERSGLFPEMETVLGDGLVECGNDFAPEGELLLLYS